jgi:hypothetical protein
MQRFSLRHIQRFKRVVPLCDDCDRGVGLC